MGKINEVVRRVKPEKDNIGPDTWSWRYTSGFISWQIKL